MFQSIQGGNNNISNSWRHIFTKTKIPTPPTRITFDPQADGENLAVEITLEFAKDFISPEGFMEGQEGCFREI